MSPACASVRVLAPAPLCALLAFIAFIAGFAAAAGAATVADDGVLYDLSEEQYYSMPRLFELEDYPRCVATRGVYCLGSFHLAADGYHQLFDLMQRYSANWVDNFNHTRLHRGVCVTASCARYRPPQPAPALDSTDMLASWFASCVNATTMSSYNLSAHLYKLDYCHRGPGVGEGQDEDRSLSASERAFAGLVAVLLALAAVSTVLDITLPDHARKGASWALSWSVGGSWRALVAAPPSSSETELRTFDGLRVLCMMCVIVEHVCWITTHSYLADTRTVEKTRRAVDVVMMANSTLVVQIFFMMSSFLLAHKLLLQRRRGETLHYCSTFFQTIFNRIIRISPSYYVVVWFAASWWQRGGRGPMWAPLVTAEADTCRRKWWTHLLYLNNVLYADDKCLIQTWYLAADMQLYCVSLALTLALWRLRRGAVHALAGLLAASVALLFAVAYHWRLVPTFLIHRPESVRQSYSDEHSFNVLYQSPLGNLPGALAGLLLAHLHHALLDAHVRLVDYKVFRWASVASVPLAVWWVAVSPLALGAGGPARAAAAALAAVERTVFALFVGTALLGAMHGVPSVVCSWLSWRGWARWARLSFGALLLHMPINKALVAARLAPTQLDRRTAIPEWFGVAFLSYMAALPLALLVEIPTQRLHRALTDMCRTEPKPPEVPGVRDSAHEKTDL